MDDDHRLDDDGANERHVEYESDDDEHMDDSDEESGDEDDDYDDEEYSDDEIEDDDAIGNAMAPYMHAMIQHRFDELCVALQANDENATRVDVDGVDGYGIPLGNALMGNTRVSSIDFELSPEALFGSEHNDDEVVDLVSVLQPFLRYLREGPALRDVHITSGLLEYMRPFVQAIGQNSAIDGIFLEEKTNIPTLEVATLLRNTRSLKSFVVPLLNSVDIAQAFAANRTLERVAFYFDPAARPVQNGAFLQALMQHERLNDMILIQEPESSIADTTLFDVAVRDFLQATSLLTSLSLFGHSFTGSRMQHLIDGLSFNNSLTSLRLAACKFDQEALVALRRRVATTVTSVRLPTARTSTTNTATATAMGDTNAAVVPCIQYIHVEAPRGMNTTVAQQALAHLAVLCGGQLQRLYWDCPGDCSAFWTTLLSEQQHTAKSKLRLLKQVGVEQLNKSSLSALLACLPALPGLETIHFESVGVFLFKTPKALWQLVRAIQRSGSLQRLTYGRAVETSSFAATPHARRIKAILARNRLLSPLLAKPELPHAAATVAATDGNVGEKQDADHTFTPMSTFPRLWDSAMQAPLQTPTWMLTGLLALSEAIDDFQVE